MAPVRPADLRFFDGEARQVARHKRATCHHGQNGTVVGTDTSTTRTPLSWRTSPASHSEDLTGDLGASKRAHVSTTVLRLIGTPGPSLSNSLETQE